VTLDTNNVYIIGDDKPSVADLLRHVPPSYALHWKVLGKALGFENYQLETISVDNADRTWNCFRSMLLQWLHHHTPTWGQMDDAIKHIRVSTNNKGMCSVCLYSHIYA